MKFLLALFVITVGAKAHVLRDSNLDSKVVGGKPASPGQFPYIVSLKLWGISHNCGGSIISNNWILTAAHCLEGLSPSDYVVLAGTNKLNQGGDVYEVEELIVHSNYQVIGYDIGLVKVKDEIRFSNNVKPINLQTEFINVEQNLTLSGWGRTDVSSPSPNDLQFIDLSSISVSECELYWKTNEKQICTLTKKGEGSCMGDSGGPLTFNDKITGIVSGGEPCAVGIPDIFTRVSEHIQWIKDNTDISTF